jgi:putative aminopeptidase FrvX
MKNQREKRLELLEKLLSIPGCSGEEGEVSDWLMRRLEPIVDKLHKDDYGNILAEKLYGPGKTILLSAHMDVVSSDINPNAMIIKKGNIWKRESGILGADDRAGVAMITHIIQELEDTSFKGKIKIAFTTCEETGQIGANNIDKSFFNDISYAISLDRKNGLDIVTCSSAQKYCSDGYGQFFEDQSKIFMKESEGYRTTKGGISDLRVWSQLGIDSVNISVGFYYEHTSREYLNIEEWHTTLEFVKFCLIPLANSYVGQLIEEKYLA